MRRAQFCVTAAVDRGANGTALVHQRELVFLLQKWHHLFYLTIRYGQQFFQIFYNVLQLQAIRCPILQLEYQTSWAEMGKLTMHANNSHVTSHMPILNTAASALIKYFSSKEMKVKLNELNSLKQECVCFGSTCFVYTGKFYGLYIVGLDGSSEPVLLLMHFKI